MDVAPPPPPPPSSKFSAAAEPAPRDNRAFFARVLIAALLIGVLAVAAIFAITRLREGDDNRDAASVAATATRSAELNAMAAALGTVTPTVVPPSETATAEPPTATAPPPTNTAPADTPTPKPDDEGDNAAAASGGDNPEPTKKPSVPKIGEMLPTSKDVPDGFQQTDDGKLSKDEVAASFSDPEDAAAKLDDWGWSENVYRIFEIPADADHASDDVTYLYVSIHRFDSSDSASAALPYFAQAVEEARSLREVTTDEQLGDEMVVAAGPDDGSNEVTLYIRTGNRIVRVTAFAESGNSTNEAVALAKKVLAK